MKQEEIQIKWMKNLKNILANKIFNYFYQKNKQIFNPKKFQKPSKFFLCPKKKKIQKKKFLEKENKKTYKLSFQ